MVGTDSLDSGLTVLLRGIGAQLEAVERGACTVAVVRIERMAGDAGGERLRIGISCEFRQRIGLMGTG